MLRSDFQFGDIHGDRGTGRNGTGAGFPGTDEWDCRERYPDSTNHGSGGGQETTTAGIGWLFGIDAVLHTGDLSAVRRLPARDLFVAGKLVGERYTLFDVVGHHLPAWSELAPHLPGSGPVTLAFTPDRFPQARARPLQTASEGAYMVRGPFELEGRAFAVPPYAQH